MRLSLYNISSVTNKQTKTSSFPYISRFATPQVELQSWLLSHTPYGGCGGGGDGGKVMAATTCRILELVQEQLPWEKGRFSQKNCSNMGKVSGKKCQLIPKDCRTLKVSRVEKDFAVFKMEPLFQ